MLSSSSTPVLDPVQSILLDSIILENPHGHLAENLTSDPFATCSGKTTSKPTVKRYYLDETNVHILYPGEVNGGTSRAEPGALFKYTAWWAELLLKALKSVRDSSVGPADEGEGEGEDLLRGPSVERSAASGEGVTGLPGNPTLSYEEVFQEMLSKVQCMSSSARVGMLDDVVGAGGVYGADIWGELAEVMAKIQQGCMEYEEEAEGVEGTNRVDSTAEAEDPVLVNVCDSLEGGGRPYIETVEGGDGGDGGEEAFSHCGTQFNAV